MRYGAAERRTCQDGLAIHRRVPGLARDGLAALDGPLQRMELNRALMAARLTMHAAGLLHQGAPGGEARSGRGTTTLGKPETHNCLAHTKNTLKLNS